MERSRKHYGSASAWIFFTETIFLTNFKRILNTRRAKRNYSALFPLFIGKRGRWLPPSSPRRAGYFHQKAPPSVGTPWKAQVSLVAICTPLFTKYTFFFLFCWFLFRNVTEIHGLRNNTYFLSGTSWNLTNYLAMGVKYLEAVKRRLHATKQWSPDEIRVWHYATKGEKLHCHCIGTWHTFLFIHSTTLLWWWYDMIWHFSWP